MSSTNNKPQELLPIKLNIRSEYSALKTAIVHEPGFEIDRLTPDNKASLLFEDIPYLPRMQEEHRSFVQLLRENGVAVLHMGALLLDILRNEDTQRKLTALSCNAGLQDSLSALILKHYEAEEIRDILIAGITYSELYAKTGIRLNPSDEREDPFILEPIPNAYFSRDPAAVIGNQIVSCKMHFPVRIRESILLREILISHPFFEGAQFLYGNYKKEDRPFTIEGGDIMVISDKAIAVGYSQRTRSESISILAKQLFEDGLVERVYEINIPSERVYMHLDTVFTIIDQGLVVAYPDVMREIKEIRRYEPRFFRGSTGDETVAYPIDENRPFNKILEDEFGHLKVINTGDNNRRYASREQQADGTNVLALRPSTVITYNRNTHTNRALKAEGVKVLEIEGSELVRGLGGPRCMTMPIERQKGKESVE